MSTPVVNSEHIYKKKHTVTFGWKNVRILCKVAKDSHIFPTKRNSVFVIFTFKN